MNPQSSSSSSPRASNRKSKSRRGSGSAKALKCQLRELEEELERVEDIRVAELYEIEASLRKRKEEVRLEEERIFLQEELRVSEQIQGMIALLEELSLTNDALRAESETLRGQLQQEERTMLRLQESCRMYEEKIGQAQVCAEDMEASFEDLTSLLPHFYETIQELEEEVHFYQERSHAEYRAKVMYNEITTSILDRLNGCPSCVGSEEACMVARVIDTVPKGLVETRHLICMPRSA
jgi:chromosome segregation ATPase